MWRVLLQDVGLHGSILIASSELARRSRSNVAAVLPRAVPRRITAEQATSYLCALSLALLPPSLFYGGREALRRMGRQTRTARAVLQARAEALVAEANHATAQPLELGTRAGAAMARAIEAGLEGTSTLPPRIVGSLKHGTPSQRSSALLACRIEALHLSAGGGAAAASEEALSASCASVSAGCGSGESIASSSSAPKDEEEADAQHACKVCLAGEVDAVVAPCGHLAACLGCLHRMVQMENHWSVIRSPEEHRLTIRCPVCVAPVNDVLRAFPC